MLTGTQCEYYQAGDEHYVGQRVGCGHDLSECRPGPLLNDRPEDEVPAEGERSDHDHQAIERDAGAGRDWYRASWKQQNTKEEERVLDQIGDVGDGGKRRYLL